MATGLQPTRARAAPASVDVRGQGDAYLAAELHRRRPAVEIALFGQAGEQLEAGLRTALAASAVAERAPGRGAASG